MTVLTMIPNGVSTIAPHNFKHITISGLRISGRRGDGMHTASCNVKYPDGSITIVYKRGGNRILASRKLYRELVAIDDKEGPNNPGGGSHGQVMCG